MPPRADGPEAVAIVASLFERRGSIAVTVLFCDVTVSTSLGESVDPEALRALLARHFEQICSLDWHVISQAVIDGNAAGETRTKTEIRESLSKVEFVFNLDSTLLDTMRTPIRPFKNAEQFGLVEAFYVQEGQVMAPDDLSVGAHSLSVTVLQPGFEPAILSITFSIDAPGEGTCL